jgi:predicted GNAT family acetyltransferase
VQGSADPVIDVRDVPERARFEVDVDGRTVGVLDYRRAADAVVLTHAEVQPAVEGQGIGSALVKGALDDLRDRGERIVPQCSFVRAYVRDHPEYQPLVAQ